MASKKVEDAEECRHDRRPAMNPRLQESSLGRTCHPHPGKDGRGRDHHSVNDRDVAVVLHGLNLPETHPPGGWGDVFMERCLSRGTAMRASGGTVAGRWPPAAGCR